MKAKRRTQSVIIFGYDAGRKLGAGQNRAAARPNSICLLEDFGGNDMWTYIRQSSFTLLDIVLLAASHKQDILTESYLDDLYMRYDNINDHFRQFDRDPLSVLAELGCRPSPMRRIQSLYRIRALGADAESGSLMVFGYPIFIKDASLV
jgi:hypothetical protein